MASTSGDPPTRSGTTIVASRNFHVLKIDGYSKAFNSRPFYAGGRTWYTSFRPRGSPNRPDDTDSISFIIHLADTVDEAVTTVATFALLDKDGMPVHKYTRTTDAKTLGGPGKDSFIGWERFMTRQDLKRSGHLKNDCFSIRIHVHIVKEIPSVVVPPPDIHQHICNLLSSKEGIDVEFRVGGEAFIAHRRLLGARSPVFRAELFGPMKEGTGTNIVTIDDMEPQVFSALLTFMYTDTWPEINEEDEPTVAQHLLVAADKYALQRLKLMCEDRLLRHIEARHIESGSAAALLALAEQHQCSPGLKNACFEFLLSSTDSLLALVETEDFDHLALSCPAMVKVTISRLLLARDLEKAKLNGFCRGIPLFPGIKYPHALTMATDKSGASNPSSATVSKKAHHILKIYGLSSTCEDFDHLALSCPAMVKEMISRLLLARDLEKAELNEFCRGIPLFPGIKYPHALTMATDKSGASNPSSATVSEKAHHILKIDGLSSTCEALGDLNFINSCRFRVGGYNWHVRMQPKGTRDRNNTDSISVFLILDDDPVDVEAVMAQVTFSLLDRDHKPVPSYSHTTPMVNLLEKGSIGFKGFIRRKDLKQSGHLKDDCFAVRADIHVVVKKLKPVVPPPDLHRHLGDLLSSKEGVDVEFRVGGETFGAHRLVLAARSSPAFWAQLCVSEKDEGSAINVVEIDGMDAQVFRALLSFVYTDTWPGTDDGEDEFAMAQRLLGAADRYGMPRLKLMCENRLCNHIDTASAATILSLAEKHRCAGLKKACFEFLCSWTALNAASETDEFKYFAQSHPTVVEHLRSNIRARYHVKGTVVGWNHMVCINVQMTSPTAVLTAKSHGEDLDVVKFRRQQAEIQRLLNIGFLVSMK